MNTSLKRSALVLITAFASTSQAGFLDEVGKAAEGIDAIRGALGKNKYTCVATTSFDGSYVGKGNTREEAKANAKNNCISAGVSWVFCDRISCDKN